MPSRICPLDRRPLWTLCPPPGVRGTICFVGPEAEKPQTLALQGLVNWVVRGLLRAPLLSRAVGQRLVTVYVVGRTSGRHYAIPVAYTPHDGVLLIGTPFA